VEQAAGQQTAPRSPLKLDTFPRAHGRSSADLAETKVFRTAPAASSEMRRLQEKSVEKNHSTRVMRVCTIEGSSGRKNVAFIIPA
jgi:hypothetical protein